MRDGIGDLADDATRVLGEREVDRDRTAGRHGNDVGRAGGDLVIREDRAEVVGAAEVDASPHPVGLEWVEPVDRVATVGRGRRADEEAVRAVVEHVDDRALNGAAVRGVPDVAGDPAEQW